MAEQEVEKVDLDQLKKQMIGKAVVKACDMDPEQRTEIIDVVASGIENNITPSLNAENAARYIKESLDKKFGPLWHCVIGEGFAFDITKQKKTLLFTFYNGNLAVLVFKT